MPPDTIEFRAFDKLVKVVEDLVRETKKQNKLIEQGNANMAILIKAMLGAANDTNLIKFPTKEEIDAGGE